MQDMYLLDRYYVIEKENLFYKHVDQNYNWDNDVDYRMDIYKMYAQYIYLLENYLEGQQHKAAL